MSAKHKPCVHCEARIPLAVAVCPFCGGRQPDPRPAVAQAERAARGSTPPPSTQTTQSFQGLGPLDAEASRPQAPTPRALRDARFAAGPQAKASRSARWFWIAVLAIALGAGAAWWTLRPRPLPVAALEAFGERAEEAAELCQLGNTCVVAYLTPWDPSSDRSLSTLERLDGLLEGSNVRLAVVVGNDERDELEAFARTVPAATWLDPSGYIESDRDLEMVPTWFVVDPLGRVRKQVDGTFFPLDYHLGKLGLRLDDDAS